MITMLPHALNKHWVEASGDVERLNARPAPDRTRYLGLHSMRQGGRLARARPVSGGGTPLAVCLKEAERILCVTTRQRVRDQDTCLWLFTAGCTFERPDLGQAAGHIVVVDFDNPLRSIGRCAAWAECWHGEHRFPD